MQWFPEGVTPLHDEPYLINGTACWCCDYRSAAEAATVLKRAFPASEYRLFAPYQSSNERRAMFCWSTCGEEFLGDVLVDTELTPIGLCSEFHSGFVLFTLDGIHVPIARCRFA